MSQGWFLNCISQCTMFDLVTTFCLCLTVVWRSMFIVSPSVSYNHQQAKSEHKTETQTYKHPVWYWFVLFRQISGFGSHRNLLNWLFFMFLLLAVTSDWFTTIILFFTQKVGKYYYNVVVGIWGGVRHSLRIQECSLYGSNIYRYLNQGRIESFCQPQTWAAKCQKKALFSLKV